VKLKVLYREGGPIVSLSWLQEQTTSDKARLPPMRSAVEPGKGQRAAVIDVDPSLRGHRLSDIHQRFTVAEHGERVRLVERRG
jgi:hypothetical protein